MLFQKHVLSICFVCCAILFVLCIRFQFNFAKTVFATVAKKLTMTCFYIIILVTNYILFYSSSYNSQ